MSDSKVPLLGRLAVHYKLITQQQLSQALTDEGDPSRLGEHLVASGLIPQKGLDRLLKIQKDMLIKHRAAKATEAASPEPEAAPAPSAATRLPSPVTERMPLPRAPRVKPIEERPSRNAPPVRESLPGGDDTFSAPPDPVAQEKPRMRLATAQPIAVMADEQAASTPEASEAAPDPPDPAPAAAAEAPAQPATPSPAPTETTQAPAPAAQAAEVEVAAPPRPAGSQGCKEQLHAFMQQAADAAASDLHVHSGAPLKMRIAGDLEARSDQALEPTDCEALLADALDDTQWAALCRHGQVDFAYDVEGVGRFRANVYRQQRGLDGTFRLVSPRPPSLEELGLPATLAKFTGYHQGMVLLTGPAGCGKSATMAALLDMVNESREEHIITVEDPIEIIHKTKKCLVNQRQVGPHTETFARALRAALREDPDIIGIGELRDLETISLALTAAETGHFVLATLHTNSAMRTINRLVGSFPPSQQSQIRTMVSESLRAVISQRLVKRADGRGRLPALEIMVVNKAVGNLIRENKTVQIQSILQTGAAQGMGLLDDALTKLVSEKKITQQEALRHCEDKRRFGGTEQ